MQPLTQALPGALAALLRETPLSAGKVNFAWRAAVGSAVERVTSVRLEDRILIVEPVDAIWAREITRSSPVILMRLQTLLGQDTVTKIQIRTPRS